MIHQQNDKESNKNCYASCFRTTHAHFKTISSSLKRKEKLYLKKLKKKNNCNRSYIAIKTSLVENSIEDRTSLMCTKAYFSNIKSFPHLNKQKNTNAVRAQLDRIR